MEGQGGGGENFTEVLWLGEKEMLGTDSSWQDNKINLFFLRHAGMQKN